MRAAHSCLQPQPGGGHKAVNEGSYTHTVSESHLKEPKRAHRVLFITIWCCRFALMIARLWFAPRLSGRCCIAERKWHKGRNTKKTLLWSPPALTPHDSLPGSVLLSDSLSQFKIVCWECTLTHTHTCTHREWENPSNLAHESVMTRGLLPESVPVTACLLYLHTFFNYWMLGSHLLVRGLGGLPTGLMVMMKKWLVSQLGHSSPAGQTLTPDHW